MIHDESARPCQECGNDASEWNHDEGMYLCNDCTEAYTPDYDKIWQAAYWIYPDNMQQRLDYFETRVRQEKTNE